MAGHVQPQTGARLQAHKRADDCSSPAFYHFLLLWARSRKKGTSPALYPHDPHFQCTPAASTGPNSGSSIVLHTFAKLVPGGRSRGK
ncbi:hypothetical protein CAOG_009323 [Capsaspora owczarzaki ATCC 30864]|uniref:Uncharacterized protein n=1 Tax=Capsaspora owczarzaki (strain ATCC 30864) TaxID=595528 RepID=A0A0D2X0H8_CAPO3|nr:hypothetical protein CAOG_009323 [Capsaspora owczarzaki ATCC 30864]